MTTHPPSIARSGHAGFSLIELMIAMAVLAVMLLFFATITETVSSTWSKSEARVETYQTGRGSLELITREMTPAVVDTRMQFVIAPGTDLEAEVGVTNLAPNSPVALWISPLGPKGDLRCVGYYLHRDDERFFYRLKRLFIAPDNPDGYFPRIYSEETSEATNLVDLVESTENVRTSPVDASWFYGGAFDTTRAPWDEDAFNEDDPDNDKAIVSTVSDGVLALWFQAIDSLGNPIPWVSLSTVHPQPTPPAEGLIYNSAAYFQMATTQPYEVGTSMLSTVYLDGPADPTAPAGSGQRLAMKANRVPASVDITIITVDSKILARRPTFPEQENIMAEDNPNSEIDESDTLDIEASVKAFQEQLADMNITTARTFTTRVKLINGT